MCTVEERERERGSLAFCCCVTLLHLNVYNEPNCGEKSDYFFFQCCKHVTKVWNGAFSRQSEMSRLFKYVHCSIHFVLWSLAFHAFVHNEEKKVIHNERQVRNVVPLKQLKRISYLMCVDALEFCWDFFFISFLELWK